MRRIGFVVLLLHVLICGFVSGDDAGYNLPDDVAGIYDPTAQSKMEVMAGDDEIAELIKKYSQNKYLVFTEDRLNSIRRSEGIPAHWIADCDKHLFGFKGKAAPGEFYVFQLGVYAAKFDIESVRLEFEGLKNSHGKVISAGSFRCFNLGGIAPDGSAFTKSVSIAKGKVQALWIGIEVGKDCSGLYKGRIKVRCDNLPDAEVDVTIEVAGEVLSDHGDSDAWRLSRLRWLDSTIAQNVDELVSPFAAIKREGRAVSILGRKIVLAENGLPQQILSYYSPSNTRIEDSGEEMLLSAIKFIVETEQGKIEFPKSDFRIVSQSKGQLQWQSLSQNADAKLKCTGTIGPDGFIRYQLELASLKELKIKDIRLEIPYRAEVAKYMMGMGKQGGFRPKQFQWKWDVTKHQDCLWMGKVNAGIQLRLKGDNYQRPLVNIYYDFCPLELPVSWGNSGKGTVNVTEESAKEVLLTASSGDRILQPGEKLHYNFDLYITPFKPINQTEQWATRYIHPHQGINDPHFKNPDIVVSKGANTVNLHHNLDFNPFINYPYNDLSFPLLIDCVKQFHEKDLKLKLYYTTREITNNMPELFAFHSLDGEVVYPGPGNDAKTLIHRNGPHKWLKEHLREKYIPAWTETIRGRYGNRLDLAVITTPDTRWNNFYLEGLNWLIEKADIDGLYIDDTALDRVSLMRARRILDRDKKGRLIDLHSWNHYNGWAKYASCANIYMEIFPYVDRIWFGEGFNYNDSPPDYWLTEIAGIPYGLMSEMLQGGGNVWMGMVYGMTQRLGWSGDPRGLWKFFDEFGMENTEMIGYWDPACPVTCGNKDVPITVYRHDNGKVLIAAANWSKKDADITLNIDWSKLGLRPDKSILNARQIDNFQSGMQYKTDSAIPIKAKQGWLLVLEEK